MLAQHETVVGIEPHIERILAGGGHLILRAAVHHHIIALYGVFPVHGSDGAGPHEAVVGARTDNDGHVRGKVRGVHLVDRAAHAEIALLGDGDEGQGFAGLRIGLAVGVDLFDMTGHRAEHIGVGQLGLGLIDLLLLGGDLILRLLDVELDLLDLQGILELVGVVGGLLILLQRCDLRLLGGDGVVHLLDFELHALDLDGKRFGLIGEKHLSLRHRVARLYGDLRDLQVGVLIHFDGLPRLHDSGVPVDHADRADAEDIRHRNHRDLWPRFRAAGQADRQANDGQKHFGRSVPHWVAPPYTRTASA